MQEGRKLASKQRAVFWRESASNGAAKTPESNRKESSRKNTMRMKITNMAKEPWKRSTGGTEKTEWVLGGGGGKQHVEGDSGLLSLTIIQGKIFGVPLKDRKENRVRKTGNDKVVQSGDKIWGSKEKGGESVWWGEEKLGRQQKKVLESRSLKKPREKITSTLWQVGNKKQHISQQRKKWSGRTISGKNLGKGEKWDKRSPARKSRGKHQ